MGASIVDIQNMGDALRNTGYKNIESAVAEIIDNSVEANAKNIFLILREGIATSGRKVVTEMGCEHSFRVVERFIWHTNS